MGKSLKIAIYSGEIPASTFIERLIRWLAEEGCEIYLFGKKMRGYRPVKGVKVIATPEGRLFRSIFVFGLLLRLLIFRPSDFRQLSKYIRKELNGIGARELLYRLSYLLPALVHKPDLFHIQWANSVFTWNFLERFFDVPIIVSLRGSQINISPKTNRLTGERFKEVFPRIRAFHAVSRSLAENAVNLGASPEKIRIIHSALPDNFFTNRPRPFRKIDRSRPVRLLSVGKYHWVKGGTYALDSMRILKDRGLSFKYTIVGGTQEEAIFQVADMGLEQEVEITGRIPIEDVVKLLHESDIFLLTSVSEGIANSVLEAMAVGIPVVSTDCGGMAELVVHRKNGLLVPIRDPAALAGAVEELLAADATTIDAMVNAARETVERRFRKQRLVREMISLYRKTLNEQC